MSIIDRLADGTIRFGPRRILADLQRGAGAWYIARGPASQDLPEAEGDAAHEHDQSKDEDESPAPRGARTGTDQVSTALRRGVAHGCHGAVGVAQALPGQFLVDGGGFRRGRSGPDGRN